MFYELTHIDGHPLPVTVSGKEGEVHVVSGGILLQPPAADESGGDGYSVFQLFGSVARGRPAGMIVASMEPYRWTAPHAVEVARPVEWKPSTRLTGRRDGTELTLEAKTSREPLIAGTRLLFREAPDAPITGEWAEPVTMHRGSSDPGIMSAIDEHRLAALARWRAAWRATA